MRGNLFAGFWCGRSTVLPGYSLLYARMQLWCIFIFVYHMVGEHPESVPDFAKPTLPPHLSNEATPSSCWLQSQRESSTVSYVVF